MKLIFALFFVFVAVSAFYEEVEFPPDFPIEGHEVYDFPSDETSIIDPLDFYETEDEYGILSPDYEDLEPTFLWALPALPGALYGAYQAARYGYKIGKYGLKAGYKLGKYGYKIGKRGYRYSKKWMCKRRCKKRYGTYNYYRRDSCMNSCRRRYSGYGY